ncbi:MAG TPA: DUF3298 domain-containing protein, partial [Ruminiclostridium sp.]
NIRYIWRCAAVTAACICLFAMVVNVNFAFAQSVYNIPVIGQIAKVFTFRVYEKANDTYKLKAEIPTLSDIPDKNFEEVVNKEINTKLDAAMAEATVRADEAKKAFIDTGGKEEEFIPIKIKVNYEIKHNLDGVLSFVINKTETTAAAYNERTFYNIDIVKGSNITLTELHGENYVEKINDIIKLEMAQKEKESPNYYFQGDMGFKTISANQKFYINESGNTVIVFEKYEIAPGAMGPQEFEIKDGT